MPFDPHTPPSQHDPAWHGGAQVAVPHAGQLACWLLAVAGMVWVMVGLGGATRLTGSGLSIMEWAPLSGTLPPLTDQEWQRLYDLYRTIPQYALVNQGFGMDGFKEIFWLEYLHRLWGRLIGLAYALPLAWFWLRGRVPGMLKPRLLLLLGLGGLQGAVGWLMVASGFEAGRVAVSPYRLVIHLALAFAIFALLVTTALSLLPFRPAGASRAARRSIHLAFALAIATMLAGGFVAGIRAGFDYNSFPLMDGRLVPAAYLAGEPWWRTLFEQVATVQFNHRLLATATLIAMLIATILAWPARALRPAISLFALAMLAQYGLGIATLLSVVPVGLGTAHQALAVGVLAAGLVVLHSARPAMAGDQRRGRAPAAGWR
jgi:cytochrome c oxidase assembly protein subunit 15